MQLQTNNADFKSVTKNLKKELSTMGFNISHASTLNLASRALGYDNYNTYKALCNKIRPIKTDEKDTEETKPSFLSTIKSVKDLISEEEKLEKQYPSEYLINLVRLEDFKNYEVYIDTEFANDEYTCYLIYCDNSSLTKRVFYAPIFDVLVYYIYNGDFPTNDYSIGIKTEKKHLHSRFYDIIQHLQGKNWFNLDYLSDSMDIMDRIRGEQDILIEHSKQFSKESLRKIYLEKRVTFEKIYNYS